MAAPDTPDTPAAPVKNRGRLRVYLGAAPGVGKTVDMLGEARRRASRGTDVVIGLYETHGREFTADQIGDLPVIPRKVYYHRGVELTEMDTDAVLARHPQVVLVDELAHTNAPGSVHEKRWQDVQQLLDAGIEVITTVNIQHLESLNDVVAAITGIKQVETVPDEVVRAAEQIELVDMTPQALRRRMAHGHIYPAERIDTALGNYFREGNLTALRELALLWVADRVEEGLDRYRTQHGITGTWAARDRIVVALTGGPEGAMLLRRGARVAGRVAGRSLIGVHVVRSDATVGTSATEIERQRLLAENLGGSLQLVVGDDVPATVLEFARSVNGTQIIVGASRHGRFAQLFRPSTANAIVAGSGDDGVGGAGPEQLREAAVPWGADDDLGGVDGSGEFQHGAGDVVTDDELQAAAEVLGEQPLPFDFGGRGADGGVGADDVHGDQRAPGDPSGDPRAAAEQHFAFRVAGQGDDDPVPGGPGSFDAVLCAVPVQAFLDPVGDPEQREFPERGEVALPEVVAQCGVDPFGRVDVAVRHPPAQRLRGHVDQFDLLGRPHHFVGHGLDLLDAGDRGDHVVERFQVLDVHRGDHFDAGVQQLLHVLPPFFVHRAGGVGVREFVDQGDLRVPGQHGVGVHLGQLHPPVEEYPAGDDGQVTDLVGGELPAVGLVQPDHHVGPAARPPTGLAQHVDGLADAGGRAQVDPQPAAVLDRGGGGVAGFGCGHRRSARRAAGRCQLVQGEVQVKDVDLFLADEAQRTAGDVGPDEVTDLVGGQPAGGGDPVHLDQRIVHADVRVQAGTGRGERVRFRPGGVDPVVRGDLGAPVLDVGEQVGAVGGQVGAAGGHRVVAVAGSRRAPDEPLCRIPLGVGELLPDHL